MMSRTDISIERFLSKYFHNFDVIKTSISVESIVSNRKRKVGKKKILGLFSVNKYEKYEVTLRDWVCIPLKEVGRYGTLSEVVILICADHYSSKVYWKYEW